MMNIRWIFLLYFCCTVEQFHRSFSFFCHFMCISCVMQKLLLIFCCFFICHFRNDLLAVVVYCIIEQLCIIVSLLTVYVCVDSFVCRMLVWNMSPASLCSVDNYVPQACCLFKSATLSDFLCHHQCCCRIINNSAGDCSISLKFRTDFDHVTVDVPHTFKVIGSKVKVTA